MEFEDEVLGKILFVTPNCPTYARVNETKLVARDVDGSHTGELEIPFETCFGMGEGSNEGATCSVNVDGNVMACLLLEFIENVRNLFDWFVVAYIVCQG
jgi:hypothetical protein